jgi:hypothetical protein
LISEIPLPRLSLINRLERTRRWYSLTKYNQNIWYVKCWPWPWVSCCIAGLINHSSAGTGQFDMNDAYFKKACLEIGLTPTLRIPGLFSVPWMWPHAYQTLYAHDRVEAGIQAIIAVDEYGDFPYPAREPAKLPDIMKSLADQIDQIPTNHKEITCRS